ncbi:hypothetical protein [Sphingorhabdus sp. 109]|jgi:hypothetical protein|uniref:hypothetical protein n=1 Tax=Sphingorhabdus sp. 109 TaxID=2653173 RepID=UPI0012F424C6|nr:hypothetical protein [Sphingorhabdus sp. 109]VWX56426.1 conserved exported hypothetical protein [Sphingorhabdus sp. 109]
MCRFLILSVTLVLAACGSNENERAAGSFDDGDGNKGSYSIRGDEENSETVIRSGEEEVRIATGDKAANDLPFDIKLYPGADIQTSMSGMGEGKSGAMLVFRTGDSADEVIEFYRKQMEARGIAVKTEIKSGEMQMIGGERAKDEGLHVSVTKSPDGGVTGTIVAGAQN